MLPTGRKKDGVSESRLQQLTAILNTVGNSLRLVSVSTRGYSSPPVIVFDGFNDLLDRLSTGTGESESRVLTEELMR